MNNKKKRQGKPHQKDSANNYRMLRYDDDADFSIEKTPILTIKQLSEKAGISYGEISKLEKTPMGAPPNVHVNTIVQLHKNLGLSYEYLMQESRSRKGTNEHSNDPVLSSFNDTFWEHLKATVNNSTNPEDKSVNEDRVVLLRMIFKQPDVLGDVLDAIFRFLCKYYQYCQEKEATPNSISILEDKIGQEEYSLNRIIDNFLIKDVYPHITNTIEDYLTFIAKAEAEAYMEFKKNEEDLTAATQLHERHKKSQASRLFEGYVHK